ncbi:MAG: alpha/beta hydrolase, partial [Pseudomonadota bacterium]
VRAYLARTSAFYPPDAVNLSISQQRAVYDRMCRAFDAPHPPGMATHNCEMGGVSCRVYTPRTVAADRAILFCHGGGFVVGGLHSHDSVCADLADSACARLIAVDYRLSPEHPFPDDFNDVLAVYRTICEGTDDTLILCGDSAGGNLVAALAHVARADGRIAGQVLIYPALGGARDLPSYADHSKAPGLTTQDMDFYENIRRNGQNIAADPRFAPLADTDFAGLPPTLVVTAECDPLASDGPAYAAAIREAGGTATCIQEAGLVHGFLRARHMSAKAADSFARIGTALRDMTRT